MGQRLLLVLLKIYSQNARQVNNMKPNFKSLTELLIHPCVHGCIQMLLAAIVIFDFAQLWNSYYDTSNFYFGMFPDWVMMVTILLGVLGFTTGLSVLLGKLSIWKSYLLQLLYLSTGMILHIFTFG